MARVCLDPQRGEEVACFTLIAPTEQAAFLRDLLDRIEDWMDANPHLRGAKLDAKGQFLTLDRAYTWDDIVLDAATRADIDRHIVQFVERLPRYQAFGLPVKRGIVLAGPPGTGKTLLGKVLCCVLSTTFLWVSPGEIEGPADLQRLFALARELQPTVIFLEDLDLYASGRGNGGDVLLGELLNQLDGFPPNTGVVTLATTNDPQVIEPALADRPSRFDRRITMDLPGRPEREILLARFLRGIPHPAECLPEVAAQTDGLTGSHLQELVHLAVQMGIDAVAAEDSAPPRVLPGHLAKAVRLLQKQRPGRVGF
jgi:cell division protease FtsH